MTIDNLTVLGTGVLGSQIAYQAAYAGFHVTAWDISADALDVARTRFDTLADTYASEVKGATHANRARHSATSITLTTDLNAALAVADLVIEAVPEDPSIKRDTWAQVGKLAPEHTVFATNSSTLLPSSLKDVTGRPEKFLAIHFANHIWVQNTAEIMGTADTDPDVFRAAVDFADRMGMVPVELKKEKAGYVLNSLLVPLLDAAAELLVGGYADIETVDKTWRIGTGAPFGPFQIFDVVGLTTAKNIAAASANPIQQEFADYLQTNYIDKGKLGTSTGEGFYTYTQS